MFEKSVNCWLIWGARYSADLALCYSGTGWAQSQVPDPSTTGNLELRFCCKGPCRVDLTACSSLCPVTLTTNINISKPDHLRLLIHQAKTVWKAKGTRKKGAFRGSGLPGTLNPNFRRLLWDKHGNPRVFICNMKNKWLRDWYCVSILKLTIYQKNKATGHQLLTATSGRMGWSSVHELSPNLRL